MRLALQIKEPDGTWSSLNQRSFAPCDEEKFRKELEQLRLGWQATCFPGSTFRISEVELRYKPSKEFLALFGKKEVETR